MASESLNKFNSLFILMCDGGISLTSLNKSQYIIKPDMILALFVINTFDSEIKL